MPAVSKGFPQRGPGERKKTVRAQTDSLTYDISSVQSGVSIKFKSKETGRRMTPSFSRPCLWWSNPNRQAKRPSFRDDRTPRSMFYLPMLNPLSPSFPHKLRWRSSYSHPYSSIQFSLRLAIRINHWMGMGVGRLCPRFFGFNVNRGKLKRWGIWESFSSAYQRQRVRCCLISFVISLLFPAASRKKLLGILVCFLSSVPWDRSLVLQLFTWFSSRNLGSISPIPGVFCFGMPKS